MPKPATFKVIVLASTLLSLLLLGWPKPPTLSGTVGVLEAALPLALLYIFYADNTGRVRPHNVLTLGGLFFLSLYLAHAQYALRRFLGWDGAPERHFHLLAEFMSPAVQLYIIGAICFAIAYIIGRASRTSSTNFDNRRDPWCSHVVESRLTLIVVVAFCAFVVLVADQFVRGSYTGNRNWTTLASYSFKVFYSALLANYAVRVYKANSDRFQGNSFVKHIYSFGAPLNTITAAWVLSSLYIGDRGPFLVASIVYVGSYLYGTNKMRLPTMALGLIAAAAAFTFIGEYRQSSEAAPATERINEAYSSLMDNDSRSGLWAVTEELGSSVASAQIAVALRDHNEIANGATFLVGGLTTLLPFSGLALSKFGIDAGELNTSIPITEYVRAGRSSSSLGTTPIAETYMIGGVASVVMGLALAGYLFSALDKRLLHRNRFDFIFLTAFSYFAHSFYLGRASLFLPLQYAILGAIMLTFLSIPAKNK